MSIRFVSPRLGLLCLAVPLFTTVGWGFDNASRDKLVGVWQSQESGDSAGVWTIEAKDGDVFKLIESHGDQKLLEIECTTSGKDCKVKDSGKNAKVSLWFNGDKLVGLETKGDEVVKRRFTVTETGDTLDIEVMPISPSGKTEVAHYKRVHQ